MAHFAVIDRTNRVTAVNVIDDEDCLDEGGNESEEVGIAFCKSLWGEPNGRYLQTSYNSNFRKQFAGIGGTYDPNRDEFIEMQPYPSWTLDGLNNWNPPIACPLKTEDIDGVEWRWDENVYNAHNGRGGYGWVRTDAEAGGSGDEVRAV